jgi:hypothetical protein
MSYRNDARQSLKRAEEELEKNDDERIKYAALELRLAIEAITYDRAASYKEELPPSAYETWQPKHLVDLILDIDPNAYQSSSLSVGVETTLGVPPEEASHLGIDKVLNMKALKKYYHALGNHLHMLTIKQQQTNYYVNKDTLRKLCNDIADCIRDALSSNIYNINFRVFAQQECIDCGKNIIKRIQHDTEKSSAKCFGCEATYTITKTDNNQMQWEADQQDIKCSSKECDGHILVLQRDIKIGKNWVCPSCNGRNIFCLGIRYIAPEASSEPAL